eukprot:13972336-Alexandrium_andersonii.AAC.1
MHVCPSACRFACIRVSARARRCLHGWVCVPLSARPRVFVCACTRQRFRICALHVVQRICGCMSAFLATGGVREMQEPLGIIQGR